MPAHCSSGRPLRSLAACAFAAALAACSPPDQPQAPASSADRFGVALGAHRTAGAPDFSALVEKQGPTVVNIVTVQNETGDGDAESLQRFFRHFMPDQQPGDDEPQMGLGSGFIISRDGLVLTSAHVVAEAGTVVVRLADGKHQFKARVLGIDRRSDVALLKIDAEGLPAAHIGNSSTVKPGQWVATIGSPFGFANTVTAGVVSAVRRSLPNDSLVPFIQTDVAVNPGNSGSPLLDAEGNVIGVNSMIYSQTGGYMGVSFAIPIEVALDVAHQLQTQGKVTRGRLGVAVQPLTAELARAFGQNEARGLLVGEVDRGSPAEQAGLRTGDVILSYNGQRVDDANELPRLVAATKPGSVARLEIQRDRAREELVATIAELPPDDAATGATPAAHHARPRGAAAADPARATLALREMPAEQRQAMGIAYGLQVDSVHPAQGKGSVTPLRAGDVIVGVGRTRFASRAEFERLMEKVPAGATVALLVRRGDATIYVPLETPVSMQAAGVG